MRAGGKRIPAAAHAAWQTWSAASSVTTPPVSCSHDLTAVRQPPPAMCHPLALHHCRHA